MPVTVAAIVVVITLTVLAALYRPRRAAGGGMGKARPVGSSTAAMALGDEYLSGALILGFACLVLVSGARSLWLGVGALAGFVLMLTLVAAPLRRCGAYTLSDFTEWRLRSRKVRRFASACVCFAAWVYLLPQFQGAGLALTAGTGAPPWAGLAIVLGVVVLAVASGQARSMTTGQAVQFGIKLVAIVLPVFTILALTGGRPADDAATRFTQRTDVRPAQNVAVRIAEPVTVSAHGRVDGTLRDGTLRLDPGRHVLGSDAHVTFPGGALVPHAHRVRGEPPPAKGHVHGLFGIYSLLAAMILGTMGLPYLVLRLYSVPSARAVRRTLLGGLCLLALFLLLPAAYGSLGRAAGLDPALSGWPDGTILDIPDRLLRGVPARVATALLVAGVFCAFVSATTAIVLAVASTSSQCLLGGGVHSFRLGAVIAVAVPLALMPVIGPLSAGVVVPYAFAIAAASLCPLLLLGTWWRRLTGAGAAAGMAAGAGATVVCFAAYVMGTWHGWQADVIAHPALVTVPLGFGVMIGVSLLTPRMVPDGTAAAMARMHLPEALVGASGGRRET